MELRQINTFIRAAQMKSFSKAADSLGYSQTAVTVQIRLLEEELNVQLFDRVGRQVTLTGPGEQFLTGAYSILYEMNKAVFSVSGTGELHGTLHIGVIESISAAKLPAILSRFRTLHPKAVVQITIGTPEDLIEKMEGGELDLIYILDAPRYNNRWCKELEQKEEVVFVASSSLELGRRGAVDAAELLDKPFFLTERDANYRRALDRYLASRSLAVTPFLESSDTSLILRMLEKSQGISFLPRFMVERGIQKGRLTVVETTDFCLTMYGQIFYRKDRWKTGEMEAFIRLAAQEGGWPV